MLVLSFTFALRPLVFTLGTLVFALRFEISVAVNCVQECGQAFDRAQMSFDGLFDLLSRSERECARQ
jgi:hypothetical protein